MCPQLLPHQGPPHVDIILAVDKSDEIALLTQIASLMRIDAALLSVLPGSSCVVRILRPPADEGLLLEHAVEQFVQALGSPQNRAGGPLQTLDTSNKGEAQIELKLNMQFPETAEERTALMKVSKRLFCSIDVVHGHEMVDCAAHRRESAGDDDIRNYCQGAE